MPENLLNAVVEFFTALTRLINATAAEQEVSAREAVAREAAAKK